MPRVEPAVYLIARPQLDLVGLRDYLIAIGGTGWMAERSLDDLKHNGGENLVEVAGRMCYRSWAPGMNRNVTKVRKDSSDYLANIVRSGHGSVLEHANYTFVFHNVSRVFTHELVRHRAGVAISQESLRYVRLDTIPVWYPQWAKDDPDVMERAEGLVEAMEEFQVWAADHFGLDEPGTDFTTKKHMTSWMRRFAPDGVATGIVWTANVRTLRHVIEMRTSPGAEEEIRLVFDGVAKVMVQECPALFADFERYGDGGWVPQHRKV